MYYFSEPQTTSRHFNGRGVATYPNLDTYDGTFVDGVSDI